MNRTSAGALDSLWRSPALFSQVSSISVLLCFPGVIILLAVDAVSELLEGRSVLCVWCWRSCRVSLCCSRARRDAGRLSEPSLPAPVGPSSALDVKELNPSVGIMWQVVWYDKIHTGHSFHPSFHSSSKVKPFTN